MGVKLTVTRVLLAFCALLIVVDGAKGLTGNDVEISRRAFRSGVVKRVEKRSAESYDRVASWAKLLGGSVLMIALFLKTDRPPR